MPREEIPDLLHFTRKELLAAVNFISSLIGDIPTLVKDHEDSQSSVQYESTIGLVEVEPKEAYEPEDEPGCGFEYHKSPEHQSARSNNGRMAELQHQFQDLEKSLRQSSRAETIQRSNPELGKPQEVSVGDEGTQFGSLVLHTAKEEESDTESPCKQSVESGTQRTEPMIQQKECSARHSFLSPVAKNAMAMKSRQSTIQKLERELTYRKSRNQSGYSSGNIG
jgi:hypothetical protein